MGVPSFYKWLVDKYPKVVVNVIEDKNDDIDITLPNPNGLEFDNLYLDMNGIIHPCFHPDDHSFTNSSPTTFDQVFENIYAYIDRLVDIVRPRKLIYLAIDGVAPRAKMNQQRSRRFRTAKDSELAEEEKNRLREEFERKGKKLLPKVETQLSDSNVITPGTKFMQEVHNALSCYIRGKLKNDPGWKQLEVILSDATVPGEGEHKIMSFIRSKRSLPGYDPNTRHCLYGLDADLIMLALATHEVHFSILREEVLTVREKASVPETTLLSSIQKTEDLSLAGVRDDKKKPFFHVPEKNRYQFLHTWILREYLQLDMQIKDPPEKFNFDLERIIDDFIFICFFVGNDFLPHMPTLEIHERAIDLLMHVYKKEFKSLGGYLVDMKKVKEPRAGYIKLKRVEKFILSVGTYEEQIFRKRTEIRDRKLRRILSQLSELKEDDPNEQDFACVSENAPQNHSSSDIEDILQNTKELNEKLKARICQKSDIFKDGNVGTDKVKLGSLGWKQRYYKYKFLVEDPNEIESIRKQIMQKYTQGLCWVLLYYFSDVPSWNWYYPYYYGPFASDLKGLASVKVEFQKGLPFKPFDQLMAVLPPKSAHALPKVYQNLMTDCKSDIIEFYPSDFEVDLDGKRFLWQGICKLPFIEQDKLVNATRSLEGKVEDYEGKRNIETTDKMFKRVSSHSSESCCEESLLEHTEIEDGIMCFNFDLPVAYLLTPCLLEGTQIPEKILSENDIMETVLWHEEIRRMPSTRSTSSNEISSNKFGGIGRGFNTTGRGKGSTANLNQRSASFDEISSNKFVGIGRGFDTLGRGEGSTPNLNQRSTSFYEISSTKFGGIDHGFATAGRGKGSTPNLNQIYRPVMSVHYQSPSTTQEVNRGIQELRISTPYANRQYERTHSNSTQQNSFRPHQNTSWQAASHPRPSISGTGRGYSAQVRPYNANAPQYMGQGRGRGPSGASAAQMYNQYPSGQPMGSTRGRGRGGTQMTSQYPTGNVDHNRRNHW